MRHDGKVINLHNSWTNIRYRRTDNFKLTYLNLFDKVTAPGVYTYTFTYANPAPDTTPPVTRLRFSGQVDPRAIAPGNTVQSTQIANVRIEQRGRGQQAEAQSMGWLSRFFLTLLPI